MRILDARARAEELKDLNLFIAMTDEDGDGEVVAVKDLVDVRGTPTTGGGRLLPTEPKLEDAPLIRNLRSHGCVIAVNDSRPRCAASTSVLIRCARVS